MLRIIIIMEMVKMLITRKIEIFVFCLPGGDSADDNAHNEDGVEYDDDLCP